MRGGCRQLNSERNLTLVAQNAQLHGGDPYLRASPRVFREARRSERIRSPLSETMTSPDFTPAFSAAEPGVDIAYEYSLAIGSAEKMRRAVR